MPELDQERLEIVDQLRQQIAQADVLSPIQARSFVRGLQTAWEVPTIAWSVAQSRSQLRDARHLLDAATIYREVEGKESANAIICYRRVGEMLEWLTRSRDNLESFVPLELLAAAAYQLGDLPAMASALLKQVNIESTGKQLYAQFLSADFDGVIHSILKFWRKHLDIALRSAPGQLLLDEGDDKITWYFTVELVRCLGCIADTLRSGDDKRLERAITKLATLERMALRTLSDDASLLIALFYQVTTNYRDKSIYGPMRRLTEIKPERAPRLERFARMQFSRRRGILWTSQLQGVARLLHESSFALCTPTGSGKTLVANLALVKELLLCKEEDPAPLALYLVPSRALAGEVEAKLTGELGRDLIVTGLYGGTDWGVTDYWLKSDKPTVLVATVEKADALMRYLGLFLLHRLRLLIVDEAHQVVPGDYKREQDNFAEHSSRSIRLEGFVSRLLEYSPDIVRIALTAVAGGAASPVARWIEGREQAQSVGSNYRSTRQIVGILETNPGHGGRILIELMNGQSLSVRGRRKPVYLQLRTPPMPHLSAQIRHSIYRFNALDVLWTALHLIENERRVLISVAQQPEQIMGWYKEALALSNWQDSLIFEPPGDIDKRALFEEARAACTDYCGEDSYELALLDRGIATNHGQMPHHLRRLMTKLIDHGICPITVATSTLTEGVNLPFDIIFVMALKRRTFDMVNNQSIEIPISIAEFRNLSGRAGRPGASKGMEGITLVALPMHPSSTAARQIPLQNQQLQSLKSDYDNLIQGILSEELEQTKIDSPLALLLHSIAKRAYRLFGLDEDNFLDWLEAAIPSEISNAAGRADTSKESRLADSVDELDGVLLCAIEEIVRLQDEGSREIAIEKVLTRLWRRTFSAYAAIQEQWLEHAFVRRGRAIVDKIYPDADERNRLYQYGFTPFVGRRFEAIAPTIRAVIEDAQNYGDAETEACLAIFVQLGELLAADRGYGFRVRATETDREILENWEDVLSWWMHVPNAIAPEPGQLRAWQRFISDNIDFRLGVAIGAVVARAWSDGAGDVLLVPSLENWKETTELPWFGFWAREMLRWGTLSPFVAFALAQNLAKTRN